MVHAAIRPYQSADVQQAHSFSVNIIASKDKNYTTVHIKDSLHIFLFLARQTTVGQGLLIHEVSRSHKTTHHSR
jgi:hypothetical protein